MVDHFRELIRSCHGDYTVYAPPFKPWWKRVLEWWDSLPWGEVY